MRPQDSSEVLDLLNRRVVASEVMIDDDALPPIPKGTKFLEEYMLAAPLAPAILLSFGDAIVGVEEDQIRSSGGFQCAIDPVFSR